jgi:hypothetical protein
MKKTEELAICHVVDKNHSSWNSWLSGHVAEGSEPHMRWGRGVRQGSGHILAMWLDLPGGEEDLLSTFPNIISVFRS